MARGSTQGASPKRRGLAAPLPARGARAYRGCIATLTLVWTLDADHLARLRGEGIRLEGVRRLVADDDAALALAEMAAACRDLARDVSRLSAHCADPLLRHFDALFAALVKRGGDGDPHGLRYAAAKKMDRKARKMQRLVAATAHLCHELDVLAELEQQQQLAHRPRPRGAVTTGPRGSRGAPPPAHSSSSAGAGAGASDPTSAADALVSRLRLGSAASRAAVLEELASTAPTLSAPSAAAAVSAVAALLDFASTAGDLRERAVAALAALASSDAVRPALAQEAGCAVVPHLCRALESGSAAEHVCAALLPLTASSRDAAASVAARGGVAALRQRR